MKHYKIIYKATKSAQKKKTQKNLEQLSDFEIEKTLPNSFRYDKLSRTLWK